MDSAIGPLFLAASGRGLVALEFDARLPGQQSIRPNPRHLREEKTGFRFEDSARVMRPYLGELEEYFAGKRKEFSVPLVTYGTPFQQSVWKVLQSIPYGTTNSYKHQAELLHKPTAVRAVANANGLNKVSIIIPCHRVIGEDGSLTGYGGGVWRKKWLLDFEKSNL